MPEESGTDPYTPPSADLQPVPVEGEDSGLFPATNNKRFFNHLIDTTAIYFIAANLDPILAFVEQWVPVLWILESLEDTDDLGLLLTGILVTLLYYVPQEALLGRTIGKLITRTKVVSLDGTRPGLLQLIGRNLARLVPFEPVSFLKSTGWHDRWSGTLVIDVDADPDLKVSPRLRKFLR